MFCACSAYAPDDQRAVKLVCNNVPHAHAAEPDDKWSALLDTMTKTRAASVAGVVPAACLMLHLHRCTGQLLAGFGSR